MNKKAISPVVSTVVLIIFAAALGAIVISWGNSEIEIESEITGCEDVILSIVEINNLPQVCYFENNLEITLQNKGSVDIIGLKIVSISEEIVRIEKDINIPSADILVDTFSIANAQLIKKIIFTPKIIENKRERICSASTLELENIAEC